MRGKTNIPNRKEPIINGDVRNFVVAQNNTIAKGDFVSVVRDSTYRTLSNISSNTFGYMYKKLYDTVNKKMLVVVKYDNVRYAMILHYTSNGVEILNQVALVGTPTYYDFNVSTNSLYYIASTNTQVVYKYSIVNDEIVRQTDIPFTLLTTDTIVGIAVFGNDEHIAFVHRDSNVSSMGYMRVCSKENGSYVVKISDTQTGTNFKYIGNGNNCILCLASMQYTSTYYLYKFDNYSVQNQTIDKDSVEMNCTTIGTSYSTLDVQIVGSNLYYVVGERISVGSGGTNYVYVPTVGKIDFSTMTVEVAKRYRWNSQGTNVASWALWCVNYIDEDNFIITNVSTISQYYESLGGTWIILISKSEQGVYNYVEANFSEISYGGSSFVFFVGEDLKVIACTSVGILEYSFVVNELGIFFGEPTNYVKEYDSSYAIGFAKTGGTAGDTIQVYVPHNS